MSKPQDDERLDAIEKSLLAIYELVWPFLPKKVQTEAMKRLVPLIKKVRDNNANH